MTINTSSSCCNRPAPAGGIAARRPGHLLNALLFGGMLATTLLAPTQSSFRVPGGINLSLVDPLIWLLGAVLALRLAVMRDRAGWRLVPGVVAAFLAICAASLWQADSKIDGIKDLVQYTEYFLLALVLYLHVFRQEGARRRQVYAFLGIASGVVMVALIQYVRPGIDPFLVRGTFGNRNVLGGYLALAMPFSLALALSRAPRWLRVWQGLFCLAGLAVLLAGGSWLAILVAAIAVALQSGGRQFALVALLLLAGLTLAAPRLPRNNLWEAHDSIAFYTPDGEPAMRYPEWQAAAAMIAQSPLAGCGLGNYQRNVGRFFGILPSENSKAEADSQNMYLVLAATVGLPGLFCFLAILVRAIGSGSGIPDPSAVDRAIAIGARGALLAFAINCLWAPLLVRGIGIPLAFVLALAFRRRD